MDCELAVIWYIWVREGASKGRIAIVLLMRNFQGNLTFLAPSPALEILVNAPKDSGTHRGSRELGFRRAGFQ